MDMCSVNHSTAALAVCLGSFSCWIMNLSPSLEPFAVSNKLPCMIFFTLLLLHASTS